MGLLNDCLYEDNIAKNEGPRAVEAIIDRKDSFNANDALDFSIENLFLPLNALIPGYSAASPNASSILRS